MYCSVYSLFICLYCLFLVAIIRSQRLWEPSGVQCLRFWVEANGRARQVTLDNLDPLYSTSLPWWHFDGLLPFLGFFRSTYKNPFVIVNWIWGNLVISIKSYLNSNSIYQHLRNVYKLGVMFHRFLQIVLGIKFYYVNNTLQSFHKNLQNVSCYFFVFYSNLYFLSIRCEA
jgi:hypothetical protein